MNPAQRHAAGIIIAMMLAACSSGSTSEPPAGTSASIEPTSKAGIEHQSAIPSLDPDSPYETTPGEFAVQLKACLADRGFDVDIDPYDFHLSGNVGSEARVKELQVSVRECRDTIDPSRNDPPPPLTEAQVRALYHYYVAQAACLVAAGYPASSAPPEQVFVDSGGQWDPHMGPEEPLDIPETVTRTCDQVEGRPNFLDW